MNDRKPADAQPSTRAPMALSEEEWALDILRRHLVAGGHVLESVRRPDVVNRSSRDVDFLVAFDGRDVAIEVTRLDQERQWWVLVDRLQAAIVQSLGEWPSSAPGLIIELRLLRTGSYPEIDRAGPVVAGLAREWVHDPRARTVRVAENLVDVTLTQRRSSGLGFLRHTAAHDTWLDPRAAAFVRKILTSKGSQGLAYTEVWLLVIDAEVIIGIDLIEQALADARDGVPANWKRLYLLPATDPADVQCVMLSGAM